MKYLKKSSIIMKFVSISGLSGLILIFLSANSFVSALSPSKTFHGSLNFKYFGLQSISIENLPQVDSGSSEIKLILSIVFTLIGAMSLLVITIAGFRYIVSRGEPQEIARAKNSIIYALVGLVVSILAFSIVNFVVGNL